METQNTTSKRKFRMLIGDDSYVDKRTASNALCLMMCGMADITKTHVLEGEFVNDTDYFTPEFPLGEFEGAEIRAVSSVNEMTREASGNYDWIVTDMNYGPGYEDGGRYVLANPEIRQNPAMKVVFTSESNPRTLEGLAKSGANIVVSPILMNSREHKLTLLGRAIAGYYQNKTGGDNGNTK